METDFREANILDLELEAIQSCSYPVVALSFSFAVHIPLKQPKLNITLVNNTQIEYHWLLQIMQSLSSHGDCSDISAGAVIASEVVFRGTCVDEACSKFNCLARQIFPLRPHRCTLLGQSWDLLTTWIADSRYNSEPPDRALQEAFGPTRRLFDTTTPLLSGIRVVLTASRVDDGSPCLFSNYREAGRSHMQSAHSALISNEVPLLWEVSVAALYSSIHDLQ